MSPASRTSAPREIGPTVRQTAELRRLCLSLREARNRAKEEGLASQFDLAVFNKDRMMLRNPEVNRAGFKSLWRKAQYDRIVAYASAMSADLIQSDEPTLMYYICALRRQAEAKVAVKGAR